MLRAAEGGTPELRIEDLAVTFMYNAQVKLLEELGKTRLNRLGGIKIGTVDGFQGSERDYVIVDLMRSNPQRNLGFLSDERRLNVAFSRGRKKTIIVGDLTMYSESAKFGNFAFCEPLYRIALYCSRYRTDRVKLAYSTL
ncbi:uncharacterized protein DFL_006349 [Arthrobotrys flagrans]|uniref:DNA2/NAM7 helicase-like C-terminal domain-containing protein n=1 Tax=Arthrobotrys flagrans TaxID=97331 RepID=A0A437A043_ARTFL|nr:hypothetical protein DFL_006349 [Arthrobotrys flagrans]